MKLLSNGFEYKITTEEATLFYSEQDHPLAKKVTKAKYANIIEDIVTNDGGSLKFESQGEHFYYAFSPLEGLEKTLLCTIVYPIRLIKFETNSFNCGV